MLKKFSKILLASLLIILTVSSFSVCYADIDGEKTKSVTEGEAVTTSETEKETTAEEEIYTGDLYLFDNDIVMDKLVDGNVFIFGSNVEITGQVNGNLFVFANKVSFNGSYVRYSIFACANSVYYNGACNDLYVATNDLEMTYDSYVVRDLKSLSASSIIKAAIGRDADLIGSYVNFGEGEDISVIYGNLRYSTAKEIEIPEGVITETGSVTYTKPSELENSDTSIADILIGFATAIVTVLALYIILNKVAPKFVEKVSNSNISALKLLKAFGIGIATVIIVLIFFVLLIGTAVGAKLAIILALLFAILCLIAVPVLSIKITNLLKPALKIEKNSMFYLILTLVSIVLYGIGLIPFVGTLLGLVIKLIAIGLLVDIYLPHKELTDEEKAVIAEAKKQAKEEKEKRKQEKLELKATKKQEKVESKKAKKENKD